jgi:hypothetical protein
MKKRWMKSVIEASKQDMPTLPFERRARSALRKQTLVSALRRIA